MFQILSKMFDLFKSKEEKLRNKINRYLELENDFKRLNSDIEDIAQEFHIRKSEYDTLKKGDMNSPVSISIEQRYHNFEKSHLKEVGNLKRTKDRLEKSMRNLLSDDVEFATLVESEKLGRKYKTILKSYRDGKIDLNICDTLLKAAQHKYIRKTLDGRGEVLKNKKEIGKDYNKLLKKLQERRDPEGIEKRRENKVKYSDNVVYNQKGQILLLKRSELDQSKPGYYTIPGGHVDLGEDCETAAKRELEEEAGITVQEVTQVGEFEDDKVHIKYFQSYTDQEPILQEEEIWSYEWVEPKDLKNYQLPFNMGENLDKILFPNKQLVVKINKSFESGLINEKQRVVLLKSVLEKAKMHKYLYKKPLKDGKFLYIYSENDKNNKNEQQETTQKENKIEEYVKTISTAVILDSIRGGNENDRGEQKATQQLIKLREVAESKGFLREPLDELKNDAQNVTKGTEAVVLFGDKDDDKIEAVLKAFDASKHLSPDEDLTHFIERVELYNKYFPETSLEFKGLSNNTGNNLLFSQHYINGTILKPKDPPQFESFKEAQKRLKEEGKIYNLVAKELKKRYNLIPEHGSLTSYKNNDIKISDIHLGNVMKGTDGKLYFIDMNIEPNKEGILKKALDEDLINRGQYKALLNNIIEKAQGHKYIRKEFKDGKWEYIYEEKEDDKKFKKELDYAEQVIRGKRSIERLSPEEEQGRLLGGKRNVEATIIAGASKNTNSKSEVDDWRKEQEIRLKEYAQKENIWVDDYKFKYSELNYLDAGGEAEVYYDEKNKEVYKVHHYPFEQEPLKLFDRTAIHNTLFPEVKLELVGFTDKKLEYIDKPVFAAILKQEFVETLGESVTQEEMDIEMKKRGFPLDEDSGMYMNEDYTIGDLHPGNVLRSPEGNYLFIDPLIEINTPEAGYGGKRKLGDINIDPSNALDKALENDLINVNQYQALLKNVLEKSKKAHIGEIREWSGKKMKKVAPDKWEEVKESKEQEEDELVTLENKKQELLKEVEGLVKTKKKLYSNVDIESSKSNDEKKLEKEINDLFSQINSIVFKKREIIKQQNINKSEEDDLQKARTKHSVGTIITRKDGQKYKKVSETGNSRQDWQLIKKDKQSKQDENSDSKQSKQKEDKNIKVSLEELKEHAKNTSETALNNAIKQSPEPEVRQTAHEELKRREEEEKPQEEKDIELNKNINPQDKFEKETGKSWDKEAIRNLPSIYKDIYDLKDYKVQNIKLDNLKLIQGGEDRINNSSKFEAEMMQRFVDGKVDIEDVRREDFYPIIVDAETMEILDGNHRYSSYEMNNYDKIKAILINKKDIQKSETDNIKGGKADNLTIQDIADKHKVSIEEIKKQFKQGIEVEMEHTDDPAKAAEICRDHLFEFPDYYTRLAKMEDEAKKEQE